MGDLEAKVISGQPLTISARLWNDMVELVRIYRRNRFNLAGMIESAKVFPRLTVAVKNSTGVDLSPSFQILTLGDSVLDVVADRYDANRRPLLDGTIPADSDDKIGVLQSSVEANGIVSAAIQGVTVCRVKVNDLAHKYAKPVAGQHEYLESSDVGQARIIGWWDEGSDPTYRLALVWLFGMPRGPTGTGTDNHITRWNGTADIQDSASTIEDSGALTVYNVNPAVSDSPLVRLHNDAPSAGSHRSYVFLQPYNSGSGVYIGTSSGTSNVFGGFSITSDAGGSSFHFGIGTTMVALVPYHHIAHGDGLVNVTTTTTDVLQIRGGDNSPSNPYLTPASYASIGFGIPQLTIKVPGNGFFSVMELQPDDDTEACYYAIRSNGVSYLGYTGGDFVGGLRVGTSPMPSLGANSFTGSQTISSGTVPALSVQQTVSDASDTVRVLNAAGTTTARITGAGDVIATSFTGSGSGLTGLNASNLSSGTIPSARIGTVDGGTW